MLTESENAKSKARFLRASADSLGSPVRRPEDDRLDGVGAEL